MVAEGCSRVEAAARNNAEWCDTFCTAHGLEDRFTGAWWASPARTPPLYPDAVTLHPHVAAESLLAAVEPGAGCSVKDSFADLDLAAAGFRTLFDAVWLLAGELRPGRGGWRLVRDADELAGWSAAWGGRPEDPRFFPPSLLEAPSLRFLVRTGADGSVLGGAVASRGGGVVGISNLFAADGDLEAAYLDAAATARDVLGPSPLVAYDRGSGLVAARAAGFDAIGELRVWLAG